MKFLPNLKEGYIPPSTGPWWGLERQPSPHFLNSKSIFLNSLDIPWSNRINNSHQDLKNNWMNSLGKNGLRFNRDDYLGPGDTHVILTTTF